MIEWIITVLRESVLGSLGIIRTLVLVIIPLMIVLQIMTDYKWFEKLSTKTKWVSDFLGVSKNTLIPILIGLFAGLGYGAGAIIFAKEKYNLTKDDIFLALCFLTLLHGVFETTLIFWAIGVNPLVTLSSRLTLALVGTLIFKWRIQRKKNIVNEIENH